MFPDILPNLVDIKTEIIATCMLTVVKLRITSLSYFVQLSVLGFATNNGQYNYVKQKPPMLRWQKLILELNTRLLFCRLSGKLDINCKMKCGNSL